MNSSIPFRPIRRFMFIAFISLSCAACSKGGPQLHPVEGKVLFQEQPAEGASVVFVPVASTGSELLQPSGAVRSDGSFSLETYPHGKGAPPGDYKVVVMWFPPNARELDNPKNKAPAKYSDATTTPLTATIKEGPNTLQAFQLTK